MPKFKIGDKVQSRYRARWKGIIVDIISRNNFICKRSNYKDYSYIATIIPMTDRTGHPQKIKRVKELNFYWLIKTNFDDKYIRQDWIKQEQDKM